MTDYERRHRDAGIAESDRAIVRVQFSPSQSLAAALKRFSLRDRPIRLYSSRMVTLRYDERGYTPKDRQWLSTSEDRVHTIANHQQRLASHVLLRNKLSDGSLGIGLQLLPDQRDRNAFGEFALDSDVLDSNALPTDYMDVHVIIPVENRVPEGVALNLATSGLRKLLHIDDPDLHPDGGSLAVPYRDHVFAHDARLISRNPTGRHLH